MDWKYYKLVAKFEKGDHIEHITEGTYGKCLDEECSCDGKACYETNPDFEQECDDLLQEGYIFKEYIEKEV